MLVTLYLKKKCWFRNESNREWIGANNIILIAKIKIQDYNYSMSKKYPKCILNTLLLTDKKVQ